MGRRVVVTGIGVLTPLGNTWQEFWKGILDGRSGVSRISLFDTTKFDCKIAAEVKSFNPEDFIPKKEVRKMDRVLHFAAAAAKLALEDGKLEITPENAL